jgi:DNA-binding transcriptional MocR family regulator
MLTTIATSQFNAGEALRKYLSRFCEGLGEARLNVVRAFERVGLELYVEPADGMFVWAKFQHIPDSLSLAEASQRHGMLAPSTVFRPHLELSAWMRFNVAVCEANRAQNWLQRLTSSTATLRTSGTLHGVSWRAIPEWT